LTLLNRLVNSVILTTCQSHNIFCCSLT